MLQSFVRKISYDEYVSDLENLGWKKTYQVITEKDTDFVTIKSGKIGKTALIVDVKCPHDKKISIKGTREDISVHKEPKYTLRVRFADEYDTEVHKFTFIRITNETTISGLDQVARIFYVDISDDKIKYDFVADIEIDSDKSLSIYVVGECPENGPYIPDVNIDASHVKFSLGCDVWTKE